MKKGDTKQKRYIRRRARIRRDPAGRVALAVGDYLKTKGWNVLMTTGARVEQEPFSLLTNDKVKKHEYRFVVGFIGRPPAEKQR
jgi:hypothetical protein